MRFSKRGLTPGRSLAAQIALVCLIGLQVFIASTAMGSGGAWNQDAKISLHLEKVNGRESPPCMPSSGMPPCNQGESHLAIQGELDTEYFVFVLMQDGDSYYGFNSVEFGISYDDTIGKGVDIESWQACGDSSFGSPDWFKKSGSYTRVAWTNCQFAPVALDLDKRPGNVIGVFKVIAHSPDVLSVSPLPPEEHRDKGSDFSGCWVRSCPGLVFNVDTQHALGSIGFGKGHKGCDPCKGRWSPFATFQNLKGNELASLKIHLGYVGGSTHAGDTQDLMLEGKSSVSDRSLFSFIHAGEWYPNLSIKPEHLRMSNGMLQRVIKEVSTLTDLTDGDVDTSYTLLGFQMVASYRDTIIGFESRVNETTAEAVLQRIRKVLESNWDYVLTLDDFACQRGLQSGPSATDVSGSVKLEFVDYAHTAHRKLRMTNVSKATLLAPISVALAQPLGMDVVVQSLPYQRYPVCGTWNYGAFDVSGAMALRPGQTIEFDLKAPEKAIRDVDYKPMVFSGRGVRSIIDPSQLRK